jgi:hypothetical protein
MPHLRQAGVPRSRQGIVPPHAGLRQLHARCPAFPRRSKLTQTETRNMVYAKVTIMRAMNNVDPDTDNARWNFLNTVLCAIAQSALIDDRQDTLLIVMLNEAANEFLSDKHASRQWALKIASWINCTHLANRT